jgi:hypothetical protein
MGPEQTLTTNVSFFFFLQAIKTIFKKKDEKKKITYTRYKLTSPITIYILQQEKKKEIFVFFS